MYGSQLIIEYLVGYLCVIIFMLLLKMFGAMLFFTLNINIRVLNIFNWCMFKAFRDCMRGLAWAYLSS